MSRPARKNDSYTPKMSQLLTLLDVARYMGEKRELDALLRYIAEQGIEALECERCSIFLHNADTKTIWSKVATGTGEIISFPEKMGIAGECIDKQQVIFIENPYNDPRFNPEIDKITGYSTKSLLAVPMKNNDGRAIGCFQALNKKDSKHFSNDDAQFALAFSGQAAVSIESALLYEQNMIMIKELTEAKEDLQESISQIKILHDIDKVAHEARSLKEFFQLIFGRIAKNLDSRAVSILIESDHGKWWYFVSDEQSKKKFQEHVIETNPRLEGLVSDYVSVGKILNDLTGKLASLDEWLDFSVQTRSVIPCRFGKITQEGETLRRKAILQIIYDKAKPITQEHMAFMDIVSSNISAIIEKRLLIETQAQSNRLATIGQLSSTIFHDFKNPMASIRGIAEIIGMSDDMSHDQTKQFCNIIQTQVDRCCGMIEELLAFTRGETNFDFKENNLKEFFEKVHQMLKVDAERFKINLTISCTVDGTIKFDADKLMRVIFNLTNNAFEILKEGDSLDISSKPGKNGFVQIEITDSGPGVPSHLEDTLFEVFVTHGKKNGTGLGLNIARQIIQGHGGEIYLDKSYKSGARFILTLHPSPSVATASVA